jgi:two-component system, response regulator PdtaR
MEHPAQSRAVLVVEDEAIVRIDTAATIEEAGFKVYEAGSAAEAMRLLKECADIGFLLTDVEIPGPIDGLALAYYARVRSDAIVIIMTSGRRVIGAHDLPRAAALLAKHYQVDEVVEKLREMGV